MAAMDFAGMELGVPLAPIENVITHQSMTYGLFGGAALVGFRASYTSRRPVASRSRS
jgi:hypothetical protein